ncbi:MAG: hypothetical protein JSV03_08290, partial [Planctomycetota bacterium]
MRKKINRVSWAHVLVGLIIFGSVAPAWAVLNNGFETAWVYATNRAKKACTGQYIGAICAFDDVNMELQQAFQVGEEWVTLTFAGTGTNDARLFVARGNALPNDPSSDIELAELDSAGNVVGTVKLLSALTWVNPTDNIYPKSSTVGVQLGNLRYSIYHGTLFLSLTPEADELLTPVASKVYEIDLALTTVLKTYTGPTCLGSGDPAVDRPFISLNPNDGTLYLSGQNLGEATNTGLGDLLAIDTTTSASKTIIDGTTMNAGDSQWLRPTCPVYRGNNHPDNDRPTIVQIKETPAVLVAAMEYYLDANDGNFPPDGNLVKKADHYTANQMAWRGQLDEYNGYVMSVRRNGGSGCGKQGGIDQLRPDDVSLRPLPANYIYRQHGWLDVASPGFRISGVIPIDQQQRLVQIGLPADPVEFYIRNKGYTCSDSNVNYTINYTAVENPDVPWLTLDKTSGSITPGNTDTVTANINTAIM